MSTEAQRECSKCSGPLDTSGYPLWCGACRKTYNKEYESTRETLNAARGFRQGVEGTKTVLAGEFEQFGHSSFTGQEIGQIIRNAPGPSFDADAPAKD